MRKSLVAMLLCGYLLLSASPVAAHGERMTTKPEAGSTVGKSPKHVYVNLTEPPASPATMSVKDGCNREVLAILDEVEQTLHATLDPGQPGRWEVTYKAISKVDGHPSKDRFSFRVSGKPDCDAPEPSPEPDGSEEPSGDGDEQAAPPSEGGSSSTLLFVGAGTLVLLGAAFGVRAAGSRR